MNVSHATYLDSLDVQLQAVLCNKEFLHVFALITLKLNHFSHLTVSDNGTIAGELLLDDLENLLLVEFLGQALDCGQSLTTIALLDTNVDVILTLLFNSVSGVVVGLREGVCEGMSQYIVLLGSSVTWLGWEDDVVEFAFAS